MMDRNSTMEPPMTQTTFVHPGATRPRGGPAWLEAAIQAFAQYRARRQTERALAQLDDRVLADIGLSRADIDLAAAMATGTPLRRASIWSRMAARIQAARGRARMVEDLHRLPDHILNDIGIQRWQIEEAVDGILAKRAPADAGVRTTHGARSPVHGLLSRLESAILPMRQWQMSRVAAGQLARFDRGTLADLGYVKGDVDWVPEVMAKRRLIPAANRNQPHAGVA
jgi:uncharacterized protein YjiS (DUF1127 family)